MEGHSHRGSRGEESGVDVSSWDGWRPCRRESRGWSLDWGTMHHRWGARRWQTHWRATVHWWWRSPDRGWETHRWSSNVRWGPWRRGPVDGGSREGWRAMRRTSAHRRRTTHGGTPSSTSKISSSGRAISGAIPGSTSLTSTLWGPGLALGFKLVQGLLGGVGDHRVLSVQLLLWQHVHHLPHARFAAKTDTAKALALPIRSIFIELHLDEVRDAKVDNAILDVLVSGPPGQVANVQLPPPPLLSAAATALTVPSLLLLLLHHRLRLLLLILTGAGGDHIVIEIIVLVGEVFLWEILLDISIEVDVNTPVT